MGLNEHFFKVCFPGSGRCPGLDPGGDLAQPANPFLREGYQGRRMN